MKKLVEELAAALRGMLSDWEDQFGDGACDCPHEPYNEKVCNCCKARVALAKLDGTDAVEPSDESTKPTEEL